VIRRLVPVAHEKALHREQRQEGVKVYAAALKQCVGCRCCLLVLVLVLLLLLFSCSFARLGLCEYKSPNNTVRPIVKPKPNY
jgi:hypothetical protein